MVLLPFMTERGLSNIAKRPKWNQSFPREDVPEAQAALAKTGRVHGR